MAGKGEIYEKFLTVATTGEGRLTEKMSRFLSFAIGVDDEQTAKDLIKKFSNDYHDARHVCWAYMLGADRSRYLSSDNGEPSGTAGKPILGQINSFSLTNVLVIVVRYFGGIKLGTSGLISAYREASRLALEDAGVKEVTCETTMEFTYGYADMNRVMKIIKENSLEIKNQAIDNECNMLISVPLSIFDTIKLKLENISSVRIK